jgi:biotin operon repressor
MALKLSRTGTTNSPRTNMTPPPATEASDAPLLDTATMTQLIDHPRFDAAMLAAATAMVELYRGHWVLNRLVNDRGRFILGLMILDLHFVMGDGAGFTTAQLRDVAGAHGVCSPGRITAFVASLRLLGFLRPVAADDRRERRLVPTERFLAMHRERWRRSLEALALIRAEGETAAATLGRPAFMSAFAHTLVGAYLGGLRVLDVVPELRRAADRDAGLTVLFSLLIAEAAGQPVSIAALARRFAVSRAHVLTVLREAEQAGLAVPAGPRGGYRAGPALKPALRRFFALMFRMHLQGIEAARQAGSLTGPTVQT